MANCVQCGRHIPGIVFGKPVCKWCVQHAAQQRGEVPDDTVQPVMDAPWVHRASGPLVMQAIFGINVAVFLGMALAGVDIMSPASAHLIHWGSNYTQLTLTGQWWRLVSYMFVHIGIIHIGLNMWCLWNLGELAESLYGHTMFALVYLICGVGGGVASLAWHPVVNSAGASGAIFGIAGALIASLKLGDFSLPQAHVKATLSSIVTFAIYNIVFGAVTGFTDNAAHIGGLLTGMMLGALIAVAAPGRGQFVRRVGILVLVSAVVAGGAAWTYKKKAYVIHAQRAFALNNNGKTDGAIAEMQAALRVKPDYVPGRMYLAALYESNLRYSEAEAELKEALAQDPSNREARFRLGYVYLRSDQNAKAAELYQQMAAKDPKDAEAHFGMAVALTSEGKDRDAIEEYKTAAKLDPKMQDVQYNMGLAYTRLGMLDDAVDSFRREIDLSGDSPEIEEGLTKAYGAKGLAKEAAEAKQKAVKLKSAYETAKDAKP